MNVQSKVALPLVSPRNRAGERILSHFAERLVDMAQLERGARVLDVSTGSGALRSAAARSVGPEGRVIGVDCAWNVLGDAATEIDAEALRHAEARTMDARQLPLADRTFDWVLCGFALSEFSQPARALHEFIRVLKPGGSIAVSAWSEDCPFLSWWQEVVRSYADASNLSDWATGRLETPARLDCALRDGGFEHIRTTFHDGDFVYADEEEWWTALDSIGSCLRLKHLPASALTRLKTEMIDKIAFLKQSDGIHNPYRALLTLGAKSA